MVALTHYIITLWENKLISQSLLYKIPTSKKVFAKEPVFP